MEEEIKKREESSNPAQLAAMTPVPQVAALGIGVGILNSLINAGLNA